MTEKPEPGQQTRVFPPLYNSSGDLVSDRLAFFHVLERLKVCSITIRVHDWVGSQLSFHPSVTRIADAEANGMGR